MKQHLMYGVILCIYLAACSKGSNHSTMSNPTGSSVFPLAVNNTWNYKLDNYDTLTGSVVDSTFFTLAITSQFTANGATYYQFSNSVDTTAVESLSLINSSTVGSVDSAYGINYHTSLVFGSGDSTATVSSWPITVFSNGQTCEGTDKLYGFYADTTLINLDGTQYTQSEKNIVVSYDCSGNKFASHVYFVKQGVGIVRYLVYVYSKTGEPLLETAWVLESTSLGN
jgi:hypothetical protein